MVLVTALLSPGYGLSQDSPTVTIGSIAPLTGGESTIGKEVVAAQEKSIQDFNAKNDLQLEIVQKDSESSPAVASREFKELLDADIRFIVGPYASSYIKQIKTDYPGSFDPGADDDESNDVVMVSYGSTSPDPFIAAANDGIFRLVTPDDNLARLIARDIFGQGVAHLVILARMGTWATALKNVASAEFQGLGGMVSVVEYDPEARDDQMTILTVEQRLTDAQSEADDDEITVLTFGFLTELTEIMATAQMRTVENAGSPLDVVQWYTGYIIPDILNDSNALAFAKRVNFVAYQQEPDRSHPSFQEVSNYIVERVSEIQQPSLNSLASYDSVQIYGMTFQQNFNANGTEPAIIREKLPEVARRYNGLVGNTALDANGDKLHENGRYLRWIVRGEDWVRLDESQAPNAGEMLAPSLGMGLLAFLTQWVMW